MREMYEFRIPVENARTDLTANVGRPLGLGGSVRLVRVGADEVLFSKVRNCALEFRAKGDYFFHGWSITRRYTKRELEEASCFHVQVRRAFEPYGEECGTVYDDSAACPKCGAGAPQVSPLRLRVGKIPGGVDISRTIANEVVVNRRFRDVCEAAGLSGTEFLPIEDSGRSRLPQPSHFQLELKTPRVRVSRHTVAGAAPFDETCYGRCPLGDTVGLNILSELLLESDTVIANDFAETEQFFGHRMGVIRPWRPIVVSPRARDVLLSAGIKGLSYEVAHLK